MRENRKIRVLFLIDYIAGAHGGTEAQLFHILRHLDRRRFEPFLCCLWPTPWNEKNTPPCDSFVLFRRCVRWFFLPFLIIRLRDFIRAGKFDIVHTLFPTSNLVGVLAGRLAAVRRIVSSRRDLGYWKRWHDTMLLRLVRRIPACYVANSHAVKQQTITSEGISASKIIVVYNGLDTSAYKQDVRREVATIRKEYCVPEDALVVGVVAHYHREVKGLIYFVEAAGLVATEIKNVRFFLVGRGDKKEQERLIDRIRQLQLDGLFVFTGGQHNVVPFLSLFDVGVLPSLSEGLSNTLLEYMAVGLPVVATDVGGNREVIVDGRSGFLVKPALPEALAERILLLLRNPRLRSHIGEEAARTVRKRFSMETMIGQIQALYERLMRSQTPLAAAEFPNPGKHCWTFPPHGTTCNTAGSYLCAAAGSEQYQEKPKVNIHESDS